MTYELGSSRAHAARLTGVHLDGSLTGMLPRLRIPQVPRPDKRVVLTKEAVVASEQAIGMVLSKGRSTNRPSEPNTPVARLEELQRREEKQLKGNVEMCNGGCCEGSQKHSLHWKFEDPRVGYQALKSPNC